MIEAAIAGAIAGYAIAIPVGAIAVLIISIGIREGFGHGVAAAAGAATADGIYATIASLAGLGVSALIGPLIGPLRIVGGLALVLIGARGLISLRSPRAALAADADEALARPRRRTYLSLLALTMLNPATIIYFAALTLGLPFLGGAGERLAFSAGAFTASFTWQILLAGFGTALSRGKGARLRTPTIVFGNAVVIVLGLVVLVEALRPATPV
ncbi:MAG: LysE family transporter [Candidatus Limnocylindrales bacterium]